MIKKMWLIIYLATLSSVNVFAYTQEAIDNPDSFISDAEPQVDKHLPVVTKTLEDQDELQQAFVKDNEQILSRDIERMAKLERLEKEIQQLRGQLEVQAHDIAMLHQALATDPATVPAINKNTLTLNDKTPPKDIQILTYYSKQALSDTIPASIPSSTLTVTAPVNLSSTARVNPANEQINYFSAYELLKNKHYTAALTAMKAFVTRYPDGGYTDNAHYWLGELYLVNKQYRQAISHFNLVLKQFPTSSKVPASALKIGYALSALGDITQAREQLRDVAKNYPNTPIAQLASTKLQRI